MLVLAPLSVIQTWTLGRWVEMTTEGECASQWCVFVCHTVRHSDFDTGTSCGSSRDGNELDPRRSARLSL